MRPTVMRSNLALGTLFVATTVSLTVTVTGLAGVAGNDSAPVGLLATPAAAAELVPFDDCDELLQWYVDHALPDVGPYGLGDQWIGSPVELVGQAGAGAPMLERSSATDAVESSDTGTNVQEVGVDEPDLAKTDGEVVVHVRGGRLVVTDVTGTEATELGSLRLPRSLVGAELLLAGDTVLVVGSDGGSWGGPWGERVPMDMLTRPIVPTSDAGERTRLLEVSVDEPTDPRVVSDQSFGGRLLSARQHDGTVRLVLSTARPVLDFVLPNRERTQGEATAENREIVRQSDVEDWLPTVGVGDGDAEPLVDCADVRHPEESVGYGTVSVVTFDATAPTALDSIGVTTSGETVYSSTDRLYLATAGEKNTTSVHAFALDGTATAYVASGEVEGTLRDRWSMDEHDGVLRLALAHGPGWSPRHNGITTVLEDGELLEVVGSVRGLGPDEEIKSVRWFDDLAIVVTFRQTDPLYTVDLSDPAEPTTMGELKIPGFSQYLHPIGDDRLLGLGQDATADGVTTGGQASLFDVADLAEPQRLDTAALGRNSYPAAAHDPRTFTWLDERETGLAVVDNQWTGRSSLVELRVTDDGALVVGDSWPVGRWGWHPARALPLPGGSAVALVSGDVQVVQLSPR